MAHKITRVWCEGPAAGFTYAFKCECGELDRGFVTETYAREAGRDHVEADPWTADGHVAEMSDAAVFESLRTLPDTATGSTAHRALMARAEAFTVTHPLLGKMRPGHHFRTGHNLVAGLEPDADGLNRIVRFCCKPQNAA